MSGHLGGQWLTSRAQEAAAEEAVARAVERAVPWVSPLDMEYLIPADGIRLNLRGAINPSRAQAQYWWTRVWHEEMYHG